MDEIERLAILTVYVVRDDADAALVEMQLDRIRRHTAVPVTIHAAAVRVPDAVRDRLAGDTRVELLDTAAFAGVGSREHAYYLDRLLLAAREGPASHFITLDVDSFPIADDWLTRVIGPGTDVTAVLRAENGDVCLPHPSCTMLTRRFADHHEVSFSPDSDGTPEFRRFLRRTGQAGDTGLRLAHTLWAEGIPWTRLTRSNAVDLHPIIAGIYGDAVFHLGAGTRDALFRADLHRSSMHRLTDPIERVPVGSGRVRGAKQRVLRSMRGPSERRAMANNREAATIAREWLLRDPDQLIAHLRGTDPTPGRRDDGARS